MIYLSQQECKSANQSIKDILTKYSDYKFDNGEGDKIDPKIRVEIRVEIDSFNILLVMTGKRKSIAVDTYSIFTNDKDVGIEVKKAISQLRHELCELFVDFDSTHIRIIILHDNNLYICDKEVVSQAKEMYLIMP